jgi:hypothetical protein
VESINYLISVYNRKISWELSKELNIKQEKLCWCMCVIQTVEGTYIKDADNYNLQNFTVRRLALLTMRLVIHVTRMKNLKNE